MESVKVTDTVVRVEIRTTVSRAACPGCGCWSGRMHRSYLRFPRDLPAVGKFVVVPLRVRRFVCAEESCQPKTFAEQVRGATRGAADRWHLWSVRREALIDRVRVRDLRRRPVAAGR
ncbi:transposase family protein [Streptomyces sp. NPDC020792]|uniref:transposase family protein n=1 Tax=Streptomyces sp. NPDC020792 TaxID=3365089 RepID=UPI0037B086C3